MRYQVREATTEDALLIADLSRTTFHDTFAADNKEEDMRLFLDEQFTRGRLMLEVGRPEHRFYLAYEGKEPVGYLKLRYGKIPEGLPAASALEIARLYAVKAYLGKGVGSLLMQLALTQARDEGYDAIWLGVWERNPRAIAFYEQWGFAKFSEVDFLLGNDVQRDWLMWRRV
jgi:diamine N-acetyltransferase